MIVPCLRPKSNAQLTSRWEICFAFPSRDGAALYLRCESEFDLLLMIIHAIHCRVEVRDRALTYHDGQSRIAHLVVRSALDVLSVEGARVVAASQR